MYTPPAFLEYDLPTLHDLIRHHSFATLVTNGAEGLIASHVPLLLDESPPPFGRLRGHLARANPQWRDLEHGGEALAIFHGPHAYVSPSWYPSTREHGKVVPTWNYVAVHAYCKARCLHEPTDLVPLVRDLTDAYERGRPNPWSIDDAPAGFMENTARAIVGFELEIVRLEGKRKLSQNRSADDRRGVREAFAAGDEMERAVAELMPD